jgi:hypothetical protein
MENSEPTSRRKFIGTLSTAAAAAAAGGSLDAVVPRVVEAAPVPAAVALPTGGCFAGADLVALAAAEAQSGKPVMTPGNVNTVLPHPTYHHFEPALRDLKTDPGRYLETRFTLTSNQVEGLRRLSPQDRQLLGAAVDESIKTRTPLRFVVANTGIKRPKGSPPFSLSKRTTPQGVDIVVDAERYD